MSEHAVKPHTDSDVDSRRQSGTRRVGSDTSFEEQPSSLGATQRSPWTHDQDTIPTQPENEAPDVRSSEPPTVEMPPPGHDLRDTIPAPPPAPPNKSDH